MGKLYLCRPNQVILGTMTGLVEDSCNLIMHTADIWELSFDIDKYITDENGNYVQSDYYESISENMELYIETDELSAFFRIDSTPTISNDGIQEKLSVTAHSIECELQNKILKNLKSNCGTIDSLEYLAAGINNYTQQITEWISLVNYENHNLSLLHMAIEKAGATWSIAPGLDENICNKKLTFDINQQDIYSFLMKDVSNAAKIIFDFDRKNKVISFKSFDKLGNDTGILISMKNLMKNFEISSSSTDSLITKYVPKGANDLGIEYVNFGEDYILNLDYFMNTLNEYGDYKYVSSELHDKYKKWLAYRDGERISYAETDGLKTRREWYAYFTKQYNSALIVKNELKDRVPNDGCNIDYKTFKYEELITSLRAYTNALYALITLYKNEYNISGSQEINETEIKKTPYWYDYYSYKYKIIPSVKEALKMYCETDANGNLTVNDDGNYIVLNGGNPAYNKGDPIIAPVDGWLYEWELYGLDELEAKRKAWIEAAVLLRKDAFFRSDGTLRTPDEAGWNELSAAQKQSFTGYPAYVTSLNSYLDYYAFKARPNALTGATTQGIILLCESAIQERKNEIKKQDNALQQIDEKRKDLAASADLKGYSDSEGNKVFNAEDLRVIELLIKEADFQNNHILITNLNDIATTVDIQEELYQDAVKQLAIISQPQYSFSCNINNLFHLDEFKAFADNFKLNNYIYVNTDIYKEILQKVRLITIKYNPLVVTENIDIEFSTMTKSLDGISDFAYLLNESSGYSGSSSSSGGSGGGGTYGTNDADIQIANTMLNALLSTETFGTSISNIILDSISANKGEFRRLFANSGVFYGLETGELKVSGNCLADKIQSFNYKENGAGSKLNLQDGTFEFAGGKLRWDGKKLIVGGYANASDVSDLSASHKTLSDNYNDYTKGLSNGTTKINGGCLSTGNIISYNYSIPVGGNVLDNTSGSILCLGDGKFNFGGGKLKWDGTNLTINGAGTFSGTVSAGAITGSTISGGTISGTTISGTTISGGTVSGSTISGGSITCEDVEITGKIKAEELIVNDHIDMKFTVGNYDSRVKIMEMSAYDNSTIDNKEILYDLVIGHKQGQIVTGPTNAVFNRVYFPGRVTIDENLNVYNTTHLRELHIQDALGEPESIITFDNLPKTSGGVNVKVGQKDPIGRIYQASSSSKRYKNTIVPLGEIPSISPEKLYNFNVVSFRYNDNYLAENDQRYGIDIPGFIAEDVYEKYPIGCDIDDEGKPEMWNIQILFPAAIKLIQDQHKEIEQLKSRINLLEQMN